MREEDASGDCQKDLESAYESRGQESTGAPLFDLHQHPAQTFCTHITICISEG